ncbi:DNA metabolism protein [Clostridia bacterium]|nr:DNA metabolism protein [Clostridia bacterium]
MNYLYDETFDGFLTCVKHHYYTENAEGIFPNSSAYQMDLTRYAMTVETDEDAARIVHRAIVNKISKWDAERVYRVFCTNEPEKEMKMLRYLRLGFKQGGRIRLLHGHPVVNDVQKAEQRLGCEVHRLCGLIRFSETQDKLLYAGFEPDNDVLEFLAPHFTDRFRYDPFILHDKRRDKALFAYNKEWQIAAFGEEEGQEIQMSEDEATYRRLWKEYFEVMATKERLNPACQRRFMPARYWKNITEMST